MADSGEERTEAPTPKRRMEAREKGNVARSTEVNSVLVLAAGLLLLRAFSGRMFRQLHDLFRNSLSVVKNPEMNAGKLLEIFEYSVTEAALILLPVVIGIMVVGVFANVMQFGMILTGKPLEPKLEKINPISGFQRLFSMRSLVELVKNLLKIAIIGAVAYVTIRGEFATMLKLTSAPVGAIWMYLLTVGFDITLRVALVLAIIAILDYAYQRYEYEKKMKMTKQEVKEERKQMEGDPQVKSRMRSLHVEMARRRMMDEVPKATVVVTNPTYIAIAIRYEAGQMQTPQVVAKGKRIIAERIKQLARDNHIPIVEDKPLARAMYDKVQIGDDIPVEFFTAVAEILAYVYRLRNRSAA